MKKITKHNKLCLTQPCAHRKHTTKHKQTRTNINEHNKKLTKGSKLVLAGLRVDQIAHSGEAKTRNADLLLAVDLHEHNIITRAGTIC